MSKSTKTLQTITFSSSIDTPSFHLLRDQLLPISKQYSEKRVPFTTPLAELLTLFGSDISNNSNVSPLLNFQLPFGDANQIKSRLAYTYICGSLTSRIKNSLDLGSHHGMVGHFMSRFSEATTALVECNPQIWHSSSTLVNKVLSAVPPSSTFPIGNTFNFYGAASLSLSLSTFWLSDSKSVSNSLHQNLVKDPINSIQVPTFPYTDIFNLFSPDFVKLNIEGFDIPIMTDIISSRASALKKVPSTFIFEVDFDLDILPLISQLYSFFNTCIVLCRHKISFLEEQIPFPYHFIQGKDYKISSDMEHHHIIASLCEPEEILSSLGQARKLYDRTWSFATIDKVT